MKVERHAVFNALLLGDNDPAIVAEPRTFPGLSAAGDTLDLAVVLLQILFNMDFLQHRFVDDFLVPDRKIQEDRKAPVCLMLVFAGTADVDILISTAPVHRKSFVEPLRALGDKIKLQIRADLHHLPCFWPPCIGVQMKEVRSEACHNCAVLRLQLIVSMPVFFHRKVERGCLLHDGGVPTKFGITPVHIAVLTSRTAFGAARAMDSRVVSASPFSSDPASWREQFFYGPVIVFGESDRHIDIRTLRPVFISIKRFRIHVQILSGFVPGKPGGLLGLQQVVRLFTHASSPPP